MTPYCVWSRRPSLASSWPACWPGSVGARSWSGPEWSAGGPRTGCWLGSRPPVEGLVLEVLEKSRGEQINSMLQLIRLDNT